MVDRSHIAIINGTEIILLGHNYVEGILKHEYLGSQRVIADLMKLPGFERGLVNLHQGPDGNIKRNKNFSEVKRVEIHDQDIEVV